MNLNLLKTEIQSLEERWNKLLFLCTLQQNQPNQDKELANTLMIPFINVNQKLSEQLKDIAKSKYVLQVPGILQQILESHNQDTFWLGDIEILFDRQLQQNPVRLLENLGKRYKLIVTWPGDTNGNQLTYATPEHPEYFTCSDTDGKILIV